MLDSFGYWIILLDLFKSEKLTEYRSEEYFSSSKLKYLSLQLISLSLSLDSLMGISYKSLLQIFIISE